MGGPNFILDQSSIIRCNRPSASGISNSELQTPQGSALLSRIDSDLSEPHLRPSIAFEISYDRLRYPNPNGIQDHDTSEY